MRDMHLYTQLPCIPMKQKNQINNYPIIYIVPHLHLQRRPAIELNLQVNCNEDCYIISETKAMMYAPQTPNTLKMLKEFIICLYIP